MEHQVGLAIPWCCPDCDALWPYILQQRCPGWLQKVPSLQGFVFKENGAGSCQVTGLCVSEITLTQQLDPL